CILCIRLALLRALHLSRSCGNGKGKMASVDLEDLSKSIRIVLITPNLLQPWMSVVEFPIGGAIEDNSLVQSFSVYKAPFLVDLKKPESTIAHTMNFFLRSEPGVRLGIWHTVPSCREEDAKGKGRCWYEDALHDGNPIIVYLHGSAQHRAASHRVKLAKVLSDGGFHVLSVDYRGFGDSTGMPTEEGLTTDTICVYEWTKARSGRTPVCLWGHSLGTGVATNAARVLEAKGCPVDAIVLEAPFTNMWVATINYPLLKSWSVYYGRHKGFF
ncbi:hypothetical protein STEG23_024244, partial [Scotinomys teguina]